MTDHPAAVEAAFRALEEAWLHSYRGPAGSDGIISYDGVAAVNAYLAARRAAADAGYVAVMVSKEAVEEWRLWSSAARTAHTEAKWMMKVMPSLARDLAPLLKPEGQK